MAGRASAAECGAMVIPAAVLAAVSAISGHIVCVEGCGAIPVRVGEHGPELHHAYAGCVCATHPDGPEATALAEYTLDVLARFVVVGDYGEDLPRNRWAVT